MKNMLELTGRVALVTGAARGIGSSIASTLAESGATVVACDVLHRDGEIRVAEIVGGGFNAKFLPLDISNHSDWNKAIDAVSSEFGKLDILVNNAGINLRQSIMETSKEDWERTIGINLTGAFLGTKTAAPLMRKGNGGVIVNVSSSAGMVGHTDAAYTASKWALRALTKTTAIEFSDWGIRANSIHPGSIPTPLASNASPGHSEVWKKLIPMQRQGRVDEVAAAVLFLASDASSYMTGTELVVDGGLTQCGLLATRGRLMAEFVP